MSEYTLKVNGTEYELNQSFRDSIEQRAKREYEKNKFFDSFWKVAEREQYSLENWQENIHESGDPVLVIETAGVMVPWERLDKLDADMEQPEHESDDDDVEELDSGNGMKVLPPEDAPDTNEIFGRTHFSVTPRDFHEVPSPGGDDPNKIPPKPRKVGDSPEMIVWVPEHPEIEHTWSAGEAITAMSSRVEWNVQQRANQPNVVKEKPSSHDSFESLCRIHDCGVVGEYKPSNNIPKEDSGSVERKGKDAFENGRYGGGHWNV